MKKLLLIFTLALVGTATYAQSFTFGPKIGLNVSNLSIKDVGGFSVENPMKAGIYFGGFVTYDTGGWIDLQSELTYSTQGSLVKFGGGSRGKINLGYLNMPILVKAYITENLSVEIGPQVGFLINKKFKDAAAPLKQMSSMHAVDFSLSMGVAYDMPFGIALNMRYNLGMTNTIRILDNHSVKSKNGVLQIGLAMKFQ